MWSNTSKSFQFAIKFLIYIRLTHRDKDARTVGIIEILLQKRAGIKESRIDPDYENIAKQMDPALENSVLKFARFVAAAYMVLEVRNSKS